MQKKFLLAGIILFAGFSCVFAEDSPPTLRYAREKIIYAIEPFGKAEYNDLGMVLYQGKA